MYHPFADLIDLKFTAVKDGKSTCILTIEEQKHYNPNKVVHGAVLYALADTGMGAALYSATENIQSMATIEIKMNYFKPAKTGQLICHTTVVHCGKKIANLDSELWLEDQLVAKANGTFYISRKEQ